MASLVFNNNHASWYDPAPGLGNRSITTDAYQKALEDLETEVKISVHPLTLAESNIHDVVGVVQLAKEKYESRVKEHTDLRAWLEKLSSRVMYYGKVFDSLAQHHPEYVALAWGAVKLVLMGVINRATLVQKLARAFVTIGDVLPRADLNAELYKTEHMRDALSRLYAYIILFLRLCVRWYNRSSLGRLWDAIKSPYELDYQDLYDQIRVSSAAVDDFANAGARAEIRDIRTIQTLHQSQFLDLYNKLLEKQAKLEDYVVQLMKLATTNKAITEQVSVDVKEISQGVYRIEFHELVQFLAPAISPSAALHRIQSFARRGQTLTLPSTNNNHVKKRLQSWVMADPSSLLIVQIGPRAEKLAREMAADLVKDLTTDAASVFWNFSLPLTANGEESMTSVFKSLIHQALAASGHLFAQFAEQLNLQKIHGTHSESEWVDLICLLFTKIPKAFIVIEIESLSKANQHDPNWSNHFVRLLQRIIDKTQVVGNSLKILLVLHGHAPQTSSDENLVVTSLLPPQPVPPHLRHVARRSGLDPGIWKMRRPKI